MRSDYPRAWGGLVLLAGAIRIASAIVLDRMAVTASARRAHTTAACAGPLLGGGLLGGRLCRAIELRSRQGSIDLPSSHMVDDVSRLTASHSATHEEVGHGEP